MTVTDSAYIAVLQNKLVQAERSLHEFKSIFEHWTGGDARSRTEERKEESRPKTVAQKTKQGILKDGLYPGQYKSPTPIVPHDDTDECIE